MYVPKALFHTNIPKTLGKVHLLLVYRIDKAFSNEYYSIICTMLYSFLQYIVNAMITGSQASVA